METEWYPSKVDWWLGLILIVLPFVSLGVLATSLASGDSSEMVAAVGMCLFTAVLYGLLIIPIRYGITQDELIVRFGVVRQRIQLKAIQEVYPTRNPLSSPALSLDRLAIRTGTGLFSMAMISPADKEGFLTTLATRAGLQRQGDKFVRSANG
jgi:membrane protein YdbS with pleckstrin-like domain